MGRTSKTTCEKCGTVYRLDTEMDPRPPYHCPNCRSNKMIDEDFAELERRYLGGLVHSDPELAKRLAEVIHDHRPQKLTETELKGLRERLFNHGVPQHDLNLVGRMMLELGFCNG